MQWMNPSGAWALTAVLAIIGLYILKQRMEPLEVSSTYLWQKALASMEADRPFQKLRRSLLFFLQILLALLLALSLMRPMILGNIGGEMIFVFDLSASMQADDGNGSRLARAVEDATGRIDGLPAGVRISILTAGAQVRQPLSRSVDPMAAKRALSTLEAENGGADLEGVLSLAFALQNELPDAQLIFYSDQPLPEGDGIQPLVGPGLSNRALLSLNASGSAAVARVANYGDAAEIIVECMADGVLCDIRTVPLEEGEIASVLFELPHSAERVQARIVEPDALAADNVRYWVSRETGATTVVLAGRDNVFIEKALSLRPDVSVRKTTLEEAAQVGGGSLTVLDGPLPDTLPEHGALLLIDPDARVGEPRNTPTSFTAASGPLSDQLNEYLLVDEIQVARWRPVDGGTPIWLADGEPVLTLLEEDGRRVAVIGFDLHESNLPLLKEFPIFMQRLLSYLAPEPLGAGIEEADCGASLSIRPQSFAQEAAVIMPSGRRVPIAITGARLTDTNEIGVYTLLQTDDAGNETALPFALHIPAAESDVRAVAAERAGTALGQGVSSGRDWTPLLILLLLLALLTEWWVYRRGY